MSEHPLAQFIPDSANPPVIDYWTAVGRFMTAFANVEANMQIALWSLANTTLAVSRAIFSGTRTDAAMNYIRRILEVTRDKHLLDTLDPVFKQLSDITTVRNNLVHYQPQWSEDLTSTVIGNRLTALTSERRVEIRITPQDLRLMCCDLEKISYHLWAIFTPHGQITDWQQAVLVAPWLYKLPAQLQNRAKTGARNPTQPRPPLPSGE